MTPSESDIKAAEEYARPRYMTEARSYLIARDAFLAGLAHRDPQVKELVEALERIETGVGDVDEPVLFMLDTEDMSKIARKALEKWRKS